MFAGGEEEGVEEEEKQGKEIHVKDVVRVTERYESCLSIVI